MKKELSPKQRDELLAALSARFDANQVQIAVHPVKGGLKRMLAGMPFLLKGVSPAVCKQKTGNEFLRFRFLNFV